MNQEKIGKFIAKCRKERNFTQAQLAEELNITDKAISKWETGKGLPDSSIMLDLCKKLNINVNELLSGERLNNENYQEKANENIVYITNKFEKSRNAKNKLIISFIISIFIIILGIVALYIYENVEFDVAYDERLINCEFVDNNIICAINGSSLVGFEHISVNNDDETIIFITGKMLLQNKIRSHWESWETMARLNSNQSLCFSSIRTISFNDILNCNDKIKVYYTNVPFNKIQKADKNELIEIIENSHLMCQNF